MQLATSFIAVSWMTADMTAAEQYGDGVLQSSCIRMSSDSPSASLQYSFWQALHKDKFTCACLTKYLGSYESQSRFCCHANSHVKHLLCALLESELNSDPKRFAACCNIFNMQDLMCDSNEQMQTFCLQQ